MREAGELLLAQALERGAGWDGPLEGGLRLARDHDLPAVTDRADARHRVDRESHVARLREAGATAVDADPDTHVATAGPGPRSHRALEIDGRLQRLAGAFEDR